MKPALLLLILTSVGMSAGAQLMLKTGVASGGTDPAASPTSSLTAFLTSPYVVGGLALYGLGAVVWLFVLARLPLTAAYPFVGLGFIMTMVLGMVVLGEVVSPVRIVGTLMIASGCVLVARSVA